MPSKTLINTPPHGILRLSFRLPILLFHLGLGGLFGQRLMLLNHIGRKSGRTRQTVVEVVKYSKDTDTYFIVSGWGYHADWFQNLLATPTIAIQVGRRKLNVTARVLPAADGVQVILDYRTKHSLAARELSRMTGLNLLHASQAEIEQTIREALPVIALRPGQSV